MFDDPTLSSDMAAQDDLMGQIKCPNCQRATGRYWTEFQDWPDEFTGGGEHDPGMNCYRCLDWFELPTELVERHQPTGD